MTLSKSFIVCKHVGILLYGFRHWSLTLVQWRMSFGGGFTFVDFLLFDSVETS